MTLRISIWFRDAFPLTFFLFFFFMISFFERFKMYLFSQAKDVVSVLFNLHEKCSARGSMTPWAYEELLARLNC